MIEYQPIVVAMGCNVTVLRQISFFLILFNIVVSGILVFYLMLYIAQDAQGNFTDPAWRSAQPGAIQSPNWEQGPNGESCFNLDSTCNQGDVVSMGVVVLEPEHVASAIVFATKWNIRLVVKSSGHEYQGLAFTYRKLSIHHYSISKVKWSTVHLP